MRMSGIEHSSKILSQTKFWLKNTKISLSHLRLHHHIVVITSHRGLYYHHIVDLIVIHFLNSRASVCTSVCPSVSHKNFNLGHIFCRINYRILIFGMRDPYDQPFHAVTLTFDLFQDQICFRVGDHNSPNFLVSSIFNVENVEDVRLFDQCIELI